MIRLSLAGTSAALALAVAAAPAGAEPLGARDSFRVGSGPGLLCTAQARPADPALAGLFDRGYQLSCRDALAPIGRLYALRPGGAGAEARLDAARGAGTACGPARQETVDRLGVAEVRDCRTGAGDAVWRVYTVRSGRTLHVAEGLAGYDAALRLGLASLVADRELEGEIAVALTGAGDAGAFARVQAGALDPRAALAEAYRRNNAGDYAEAGAYFGALDGAAGDRAVHPAEAAANQGLQASNLGRFGEAEAAFARAAATAGGDIVAARLLRNFRAIHQLNLSRPQAALEELARPVPPIQGAAALRDLAIDTDTARRLSGEGRNARRLGATSGLSPADRARILDAQAQQLRGTAARLSGDGAAAETALGQALAGLAAVRDGAAAATLWMAAQIHSELADLAEARGDGARALAEHRAAIALLEREQPGSAALLSAEARLAGVHARAGRAEEAGTLYRAIVAAAARSGAASPALARALAPWFALRAADPSPEAAADLFAAGQVLVRPGVAQTQALLARELSGGSDEAARLFRQSVSLTREAERARGELARIDPAAPGAAARAEALRTAIAALEQDQAATQSRLADFPRYRAVSAGALSLSDLQALLAPGEAYYKLTEVDGALYGLVATPGTARAFPVPASAAELARLVDSLRASISVVEGGRQVTYPFDVGGAHRIYQALFAPAAAEIAAARHLIFEPDGAMLRLPPNLLVTDAASVAAYAARAARPGDDGFDFTGIAWLGRGRDISTAVSASAFRDVRRAAPSGARRAYLGFGENAPAGGFLLPAAARTGAGNDCAFSPAAWNRPISAAELRTARAALGGGEVVTGAAFTDAAIRAREDLADFRILHFATHGLIAPPRPDCPSEPALMTSFGGADSDGLLGFREIFDLRIDADLVILSACDTAARAGAAATRAAGLTSGGDMALDGLVRAFIGAGGRMVVASHWPLPDDYGATERLVSGLFAAPPGTAIGAALRAAQARLMDDPDTSHPYYWSGFALVGDGAQPLVRTRESQIAARR
jgi:CHAT domain-containing protein